MVLEGESPEAATPPAWSTKSYDVLVRGRYTQPHPDDATVPATTIKLSDIGLKPGDYVGLRAEGGWRAGSADATVFKDMGAVFEDLQGSPLKPGSFGQEQAFHFWGRDGVPYAEVDADFQVYPDRPVYVRVPKNADRIAFSTIDWIVRDNCPPRVSESWANYDCPGLTFKVVVTEPNRPDGLPPAMAKDEGPGEREQFGEFVARLNPAKFPEAKSFSASPFSVNADSATDGQWRGNYPTGWKPDRSKFRGQRPDGKHWGWDVYAPFDTKLIAPAWPAELQFQDLSSVGYGLTAILGFKYRGTPYLLLYAHLNGFEGDDRRITSPEVIGRAGCSGNAANWPGCNDELSSGRRTQHVHVGLIRIEKNIAYVGDRMSCDPAMVLNWRIS